MLNPGLPEALWAKLDGRLWHATKCEGLSRILSDGEIRPSVGDRYKNSFCRSQESVSLFDFGLTAVDVEGQFNNWAGWCGHQQNSRIAIWLEIDRAASIDHLLESGGARQTWNKSPSRTFIPGVEACHRGPIPLTAIVVVLLIARDDREMLEQCDKVQPEVFQKISDFEVNLPPPPQDGIVEMLQTGRSRSLSRASGRGRCREPH